MPSSRPTLLLLCLSPAAALQLSAAPVALRAATSVQAEGVTLVQQETARCILAKWDAGEPTRLRAKIERRNIRGSRPMHDSLVGLSEIAESAGVSASLVRLVLHQHNRTISRRAAAAAEGDYAFACDFLARPQAVRTFASGLGLSYVGVGMRLRELLPREERARRRQLTRQLACVDAHSAVTEAFEASGGDLQAAATEVRRRLSNTRTGKPLSRASAKIKAAKILKEEGKSHLLLMQPRNQRNKFSDAEVARALRAAALTLALTLTLTLTLTLARWPGPSARRRARPSATRRRPRATNRNTDPGPHPHPNP